MHGCIAGLLKVGARKAALAPAMSCGVLAIVSISALSGVAQAELSWSLPV
jgi:hypothetical protein